MCTLARVGLIAPAARDAAWRRQVAMRIEEQVREERRAQWTASLQGPGWVRRGRCYGLKAAETRQVIKIEDKNN